MSKFYRIKNDEPTRDLFEKKLIYNLNAKSKTYQKHLVNFNFAEKVLYGRVDRLYYPIITHGEILPLKDIKTKDGQDRKMALNFVVDAFEAMVRNMQKKLLANEISKTEEFLSGIVAYNAYIHPRKAYSDYLNLFFKAFEQIVKDNKIRFKDFGEFIKLIMPYIKQGANKKPFTLSGFMKSRYCPIECSGLVINVSNLDFVDDSMKVEKMYNSKNWDYFVNLCAAYGFMIDRNNPSRIVADIAAAEMLKFSEPYGVLTTDHILNGAYKKAHLDYLPTFQNMLFKMYNKYKVRRYHATAKIAPNRSKSVLVKPVHYTIEDLRSQYSDQYFINLYCQVRFAEEESQFREDEKLRLIDNTIELSAQGINKSLDSFELIINKTFDYRGSLSYNKIRLDKLRE